MGNELTGSQTSIALKLGATFGTAEAVGAGNAMTVESLTHGENTEELTSNSIGSGDNMVSDSNRGATSPTISFEKIMGYSDAGVAGMAQFFGVDTVSGAGPAYLHRLTYSETHNLDWATIAFTAFNASAGVFEYPSCAATSLTITAENPPAYVLQNMEFLGNDQVISGQVNNQAAVEAATITDTEKVVAQPEDEFLINTQSGGALASPGDRVSITSYSLELLKPQEHTREIKGSAGNSEPISTAGGLPYQGTLTVGIRALEDFTWFTAHQAETEYKCQISFIGSLISGADYKEVRIFLPRMKLVTPPEYNPSDPGTNPQTLTFKCLVAVSNPTGMNDVYPYVEVQNEASAAYL